MQTSIPEYFQPQQAFEDPAYHAIELDGVIFVEYKLYEKPPLCKTHLSENMFLIVIDGSKEIDAGSEQPLHADQANALFLRRGSYIMDVTPSKSTGHYQCMVYFLDDAYFS